MPKYAVSLTLSREIREEDHFIVVVESPTEAEARDLIERLSGDDLDSAYHEVLQGKGVGDLAEEGVESIKELTELATMACTDKWLDVDQVFTVVEEQ